MPLITCVHQRLSSAKILNLFPRLTFEDCQPLTCRVSWKDLYSEHPGTAVPVEEFNKKWTIVLSIRKATAEVRTWGDASRLEQSCCKRLAKAECAVLVGLTPSPSQVDLSPCSGGGLSIVSHIKNCCSWSMLMLLYLFQNLLHWNTLRQKTGLEIALVSPHRVSLGSQWIEVSVTMPPQVSGQWAESGGVFFSVACQGSPDAQKGAIKV